MRMNGSERALLFGPTAPTAGASRIGSTRCPRGPKWPYYAHLAELVNAPFHPNQRPMPRDRAAAGRSLGALARGFALFGVLSAFAQSAALLAQSPGGGLSPSSFSTSSGLERIVAEDARKLLAHADAVVRGEAAMVVAGAGQRDSAVTLQQLAVDPAPAARQRALLALGQLADAGTVLRLDECLRANSDRSEQDAVAAAFALGLSPATVAHGALSQLFNTIVQSSWKRQRDPLLAVLLGLSANPDTVDPVPLRRLYDDASNRDPEVRALLLHLLLKHEKQTADDRATWLRRVLARDSEAERDVALRHLVGEAPPTDQELLRQVGWMASHGSTGALRAQALRALARWRHPLARAVAEAALGGDDAATAGEGMRTLSANADAKTLTELGALALAEQRPPVKAALLAGFLAPLPAPLRDQCVQLAADTSAPVAVRSAAALALARAEPTRAETLLRDVFRSCELAPQLAALAQAMATGSAPVPLDRLLPHGIDLRLDPERWIALLRAGHPEAERQVLMHLQDRNATADTLRTTLRVWRRAHGFDVPAWRAGGVPSALLQLLGD